MTPYQQRLDADLVKELRDLADHERSHGRPSGAIWEASLRLATLSARENAKPALDYEAQFAAVTGHSIGAWGLVDVLRDMARRLDELEKM